MKYEPKSKRSVGCVPDSQPGKILPPCFFICTQSGLEHAESIREMAYIKTWFYRILVNESLSYMKKYGREVPLEPEQMREITDSSKEEWQEESEMYQAVMGLPEEMKTVVVLRFYEDMTLAEIAEVTGISLSQVKYRLYTGLEKLRQQCYGEVAT